MSDDEMSSDVPTKMGEPPEIDNEIDEFAESAFDALLMDEGEKAEPKAAAPATTEPEAAAVEEFEDVEPRSCAAVGTEASRGRRSRVATGRASTR